MANDTRYGRLMERIDAGARVVLDGATGSEVERRGAPVVENAWSGGAALTHPDVVREVHAEHIAAGAEIVIANTFATLRSALEDAGMGEDFAALNRRGVELACEARDRAGAGDTVVAAGVSHWSWSGRQPALDELAEGARAQTRIMADAGAELLMLEMMVDVDRMLVVLDAAASTGLPVWVGVTVGQQDGKLDGDDGVLRLRDGPPLTEALDALAGRAVGVLSIMHTAVELVDPALDIVQAQWPGPLGVYAHSGAFVDETWVYDGIISPEAYAGAAAGWRGRGVSVLGGCCGIGPEHIRVLRDATAASVPRPGGPVRRTGLPDADA